MAETTSSGLRPPLNPLLNHRKKGFLLNPRKNCLNFIHTDLWRFNGKPTASDCTVVVTSPPYEARPRGNDDWDWKREDDKMFIISTGGEPVRSSDADNVLLQGPSEFCNACYSALGYLAGHLNESRVNEEQGNKDWLGDSKISVVHHWKMMALYVAAGHGCPLCKTLWSRCFDDLDWAFSKARVELLWTSEEASAWDKSNPGDARLAVALFAGGDLPRSEATFINIFRFQLWPSPEFDRFFNHGLTSVSDDSLSMSSEVQREASSTRDCQPLALKWLSQCKVNADGEHDACNVTSKSTWHPTRLLDLSNIIETGNVRLVCPDNSQISEGKQYEYITLSHCWGTWGAQELQRLDQSNLDSWQTDGLDLASLPKTFRDAVEIAGWFGVRWLWIDSMCIIQDSAADWDNEAALMCEVYKYALLNISADDSLDARGGCFKKREPLSLQPFKLHMPNLRTTWWATVDERSLFQWVEGAPISKRAWVYQERQLSRRVLHFTKHEVFWECCAAAPSFASETYPVGSPIPRDFVGQSKIVLPRVSGTTLAQSSALSQTWDSICEEFSMRQLSYPQDKLPALAGLAKEFGGMCPSDTYLAGMWSSNLAHKLLWEVRPGERDKTGQSHSSASSYIAPSWSWLSIGSPVRMNQRHGHHSLIDIINMDYDVGTANPYGRVKQASVKVRALLRPITIMTKPSPFEGRAYNLYASLGVEKEVHLFADGKTDSADQIGFRVANVEDFTENEDREDAPETRSYICMLVAVSQHNEKSTRELQGLLLEAVNNTSDHYRRAGMISFEESCALKMRYRINDSTLAENGIWKQLWQQVAPSWGSKYGKNKAPSSLLPEGCGPLSLYDFDVGVDNTLLEKLVPSEITLV